MFKHKFFKHDQPISHHFKSSIWSGVKSHIGIVSVSSIWLVGTDEHVNFWLDNWIGSPLVNLMNIPIYGDPCLNCKHFSPIVPGQWNIPLMVMRNPNIVSSILKIILSISPLPDKLVWLHTFDGNLSSKQAFQFGCTLRDLVFLHIIRLSFGDSCNAKFLQMITYS